MRKIAVGDEVVTKGRTMSGWKGRGIVCDTSGGITIYKEGKAAPWNKAQFCRFEVTRKRNPILWVTYSVDDDGTFNVPCLFCGEYHGHGVPERPNEPEHRVAHCDKHRFGGYFIVYDAD